MIKKLEICCYTIQSALLAEKHGAHRIELCDNFMEGGTTPSYSMISKCIENVKIPVNVIVRPRGGDFLYSEMEYEIIKNDVTVIKELGANGVVVGFLHSNGEIDIDKTIEIVDLAKPMEVTFHRAFDMCRDPLLALDQLKKTNITRILTSGAMNKAIEGIELIIKLIEKAGNDIIIMPGSGVNEKNLEEIIQKTKAKEYHSSAMTFLNSSMLFTNNNIQMGDAHETNEYKKVSVNTLQIEKMVRILKQHNQA